MASSITSLFIFNPTLQPLSPKPTDEEFTLCKLLYYYPETAPIYEKQSHVGLAEGLMMFVGQFTQQPLETIRTEKHSHVLLQCEANIWLCLILQHPVESGVVKESDQIYGDDVLQKMARKYYQNFYLFHGAIGRFPYPEGLGELRGLLEDYTQTYIFEYLLEGVGFEGFYYCPLDRKSFLLVQYLLNQITTQRESVLHSLVFFEGHFITSSLPHEPTLTLYSYFCKEKNWERLKQFKRGPEPAKCAYGRIDGYPKQGYIYGLWGNQPSTPTIQFPEIEQSYRLLAWSDSGLQLLLLLSPEDYASQWLQDFSDILRVQGEAMKLAIKPQLQRNQVQEDNFRFIYYNKMNFAVKKSAKLGDLDKETMATVGNVAAKFNERAEYADGVVRTVVKLQSHWLYAVNSLDSRQIFILFPNLSQATTKVEEDAMRFIAYYFNNVFLGV